MSLQISALTSFTFQFLEEGFLQQLQKQTQNRSKPSKAVLEALKHSTSLNKTYKTQLQTLKQALSQTNEENEFLKSMIDNLKSELDFLKSSKQDKLKKFYEIQSQLTTKLQFLTNQNNVLKKQISLLKSRPQSQSYVQILCPSQKDIHFQQKIDAFLTNALSNSIHLSEPGQSSVCHHESSKFKEYVNFGEQTKQNLETQPNSKFKIDLHESNQFNNTQKTSFVKSQCKQLIKMLNLRHDSNDYIYDQDPLANEKGQFSQPELVEAKITLISSQNQIFMEQKTKRAQTPKLNKWTSEDVAESKFKVFADDHKRSIPYNKGSEFTFLNLETRKSIEEGKSSNQSIDCPDKGKVSLVKNGLLNNQNDLKPIDADICMDNISGVDYNGLMEDIMNVDDQIDEAKSIERPPEQDDFFYKPSQSNSSSNGIGSTIDFDKVLRKRTSSEFFTPEKVQSIMVEVKRPVQETSQYNKNPNSFQKSPNRQKNQFKVKITVHSPVKYMTVSESYKTIDLSKSNKNFPSIDEDSNKNAKNDSQTMKNSSSLLRSRGSPRSIMSSKLMIMNQVRNNKKNKKPTPFEMEKDADEYENGNQNENENDEPKSPTSLKTESQFGNNSPSKSYSLIHSMRRKNMMISNINNNKSLIERSDSLNPSGQHCLMGNYSIFRKKIEEKKMNTIIRPVVSFKNLEEEKDEQHCEEEEQIYENDKMPNEDDPIEERANNDTSALVRSDQI